MKELSMKGYYLPDRSLQRFQASTHSVHEFPELDTDDQG